MAKKKSNAKPLTVIILIAAGAFLGWIFWIAGCAQREIKNIDCKGANIICFGDSITFGYGVGPGEDYPSRLAKMVNVPVINAGIDGDTTDEALTRLQADVLDRDPLLVIIEFGGNDFLRKDGLETTVKNINEMVMRIQEKGIMVAVVDVSAGLFLRDYRIAYGSLARQHGAIFVPSILSGIITNPRMKSDFLHPNADGYTMIAKKIHQAIAPFVQRSSK